MDTIINITRNRNIYVFHLDTGKCITAYLENPFRIIGISGKNLSTRPKQINERIGNAFIDAVSEHRDIINREYVDRIISLPDISISVKIFAMECLFYSEFGEPRPTLPAWKNTLALLRKWNANPDNLPSVDYMDNLVNRDLMANALEQYGLAQFASLIQPSLRPYIKSCKAFRSALRNATTDHFAEAQAKVKELFNVDETELKYLFGISFHQYNVEAEICEVCRKMLRIIEILDKLEITDYKIENINRAYADLEARYKAERTERENRTFRASQTTHNLFYENDRYYIRVPLTRDECAEIGDHFHNCVNSFEWNSYLSYGTRYLVVVCDKITNEMLVCVDIMPNSMTINQFYGKYNEHINDSNLLDFRNEYQFYLSLLSLTNL